MIRLSMRQIRTEIIALPRLEEDTLETLLKKSEEKLIGDKKRPLRTTILDISKTEVTLLVSFIYGIEE